MLFVLGTFSTEKRNDLSEIQKNYEIQICEVSQDELIELFNLPDCRCGFSILLDQNNKVRIESYLLGSEALIEIMGRELNNRQ